MARGSVPDATTGATPATGRKAGSREDAQAPTPDIPTPYYDPAIEATVVKVTDTWIVSWAPMLFNDRIYLTHRDQYPRLWTAAWCYDKGGSVVLAASAYDPDTQHEPVGYKRVAADERPASP